MQYKSFRDIDKAIDILCEEGKIEQAMRLLKEGVQTLPAEEYADNEFLITLVEAILYTECKQYEACFDIVSKGVERGWAFPLRFARYQPMKELPGAEALWERNNRLLGQEQANARVEYKVVLPEGFNPEKKYPLFMALHGHGVCNIKEFSGYWKPDRFTERGFIFAYIQSSQVVCHGGYGWLDDLTIGNRDIKFCYDKITAAYPIDESTVMIGGFSGGAIASLNFLFSEIIPIQGFITLCPEMKPDAFTPEAVRRAAQRGVRGVFLEGELVQPIACEQEMLRTFEAEDLPCRYVINRGIGHEAPDDLDDKLASSLAFVLGLH